MTEIQKAYIAGIIDGEGSILLQTFNSNEYPSPCISITSTKLDFLEWIKSIIGNGTIEETNESNIQSHENYYNFVLKYTSALSLISDIYPYLHISSKRKKAELLLNKFNELVPIDGNYSTDLLKAKLDFYDEFISIK